MSNSSSPPRKKKASRIHSAVTASLNATYAFITHSPDTLPNNLPPDVDNATLARRRRRRTSQHDQLILEAEYAKNERPDKLARREITKKVGLGEKEIQIWFQNRRQTNRRKSKPLLPHEMIPNTGNEPKTLSSDLLTSSELDNVMSSQDVLNSSSQNITNSTPDNSDAISPTFDCNSSFDTSFDRSVGNNLDQSPTTEQIARKTSPLHLLLNPAPEEPTPPNSQKRAYSVRNIQYNHSVFTPAASQEASFVSTSDVGSSFSSSQNEFETTNSSQPRKVPALLKRSSSLARLAMSLEGKASVILDDEAPTPSPPSQPTNNISSPLIESSSPQVNRRTVDAKVWEVCCDSQSSVPSEKVTEDSPRKTIKMIRARKVVADAKAAAELRRTKATKTAERRSKSQKNNNSNNNNGSGVLTSKPANRTLSEKLNNVAKSSPKIIDKHKKQKKKASKDSALSRKAETSYNSTLANYDVDVQKPTTTKSRIYEDGADSDKENLDPDGNRIGQNSSSQTPSKGSTLPNIDSVAEGEMECIENLLSLRGGVWG